MTEAATIVIVPGLRDHVANHWQTLLADKISGHRRVVTVPPMAENGLQCRARVEAIQQTVQSIDGPLLFVAHSGGVVMLMHWAQRYQANVRGALLAAPPDFSTPLPPGYPSFDTLAANGWLPVPTARLPFPSTVAASTNDPLASLTCVETMARQWGSDLVNLGAVGHLNPASGFGEWSRAEALIAQLEHPPRH